MEWSAY